MKDWKFLVLLPFRAVRDGHIEGHKVPRNPLLYVPFLVLLPVYFAGVLLFWVIYIPIMLVVWVVLWLRSWFVPEKNVTFDPDGIEFVKAYGQRHLLWTEMAEVVWRREPKEAYYEIWLKAEPRPFRVEEYQRAEEFEALIAAQGIAFRRDDPYELYEIDQKRRRERTRKDRSAQQES